MQIGRKQKDEEEYCESQCKLSCEAHGEESISSRLETYTIRHGKRVLTHCTLEGRGRLVTDQPRYNNLSLFVLYSAYAVHHAPQKGEICRLSIAGKQIRTHLVQCSNGSTFPNWGILVWSGPK